MRGWVHTYFSTIVFLSFLPGVLNLDDIVSLAPPLILSFALFYYATMLPDVDVGLRRNPISLLTWLMVYQPVRVFSRIVRSTASRHRGFMHSIWGLAATMVVWFLIFAALGYILKLLGLQWVVDLATEPILRRLPINTTWMGEPLKLGFFSALSIGSGYVLHLLGDSYTVAGISIFGRRVRGRLKNGLNDHVPPILYTLATVTTYTILLAYSLPLRIAPAVLSGFLGIMSLVIWRL